MKAPATVKIGSRTYDVVIDKNAINACAATGAAGFGQYGECNHEQLVMTVDPEQADIMVRETVFHEILHACCNITGLSEELGEKTEESVVLRLSPVIIAFLLENPKMVSYILNKSTSR